MSNRSRALMVAALLSAATSCNSGRHSSAGLSLPVDGNVERGKQAFVALGCAGCHSVPGENLPAPTVRSPEAAVLGGEVNKRLSDAYLVTAMINPNHALGPYPKAQVTTAGVSRMPSYADQLTVRQMVDIVAFLQAHYDVRPSLPEYSYYR
jgi:L-cysteine S-thiosulfotransferase